MWELVFQLPYYTAIAIIITPIRPIIIIIIIIIINIIINDESFFIIHSIWTNESKKKLGINSIKM